MCPVCGRSLNRSFYRDDGKLKSCPKCSRYHGRHAYAPLSTFGDRDMGDKIIDQSWCTPCRGGDDVGNPTQFC